MPSGRVRENLTGRKFHHLTVLSYAGMASSQKTTWSCKCKCGKFITARSGDLKSGNTKSCGCLKEPHGRTKTPEFEAWVSMFKRCDNPKNPAYNRYGGRGISVCNHWRESFLNFLSDMGERPDKNYSLDRIDNEGDYCPANCRWATRNTRRNMLITHNETTKTLSEWAEITGLNNSVISRRIKKGMSVSDALNTPSRKAKKRA